MAHGVGLGKNIFTKTAPCIMKTTNVTWEKYACEQLRRSKFKRRKMMDQCLKIRKHY